MGVQENYPLLLVLADLSNLPASLHRVSTTTKSTPTSSSIASSASPTTTFGDTPAFDVASTYSSLECSSGTTPLLLFQVLDLPPMPPPSLLSSSPSPLFRRSAAPPNRQQPSRPSQPVAATRLVKQLPTEARLLRRTEPWQQHAQTAVARRACLHRRSPIAHLIGSKPLQLAAMLPINPSLVHSIISR